MAFPPNPFFFPSAPCWSYPRMICPAPPFGFTTPPATIIDNSDINIRMVWSCNLNQEFDRIRSAVSSGFYTHAALDTEFKLGGDLNSRPHHPRFQSPDERYRDIKSRVDNGRIKQVGLTLFANDDTVVDLVWQFNFIPYHYTNEMEMQDNTFVRLDFFSELLLQSGLLWNRNITWVFFHSSYDVAYFVRLATYWNPLPTTLKDFTYFVHKLLGDGQLYDIKFLTSFTKELSGGLKDVSDALGVERLVGHEHEAGSDSLLTCHTFRRMIDCYFPNNSAVKCAGIMYGIDRIF